MRCRRVEWWQVAPGASARTRSAPEVTAVIAVIVAAALVAGCAVVPLPTVVARDQSVREQDWDVKDCEAEAGFQTGYSPTHSPLLNWFQRLFFWSTAGAATGFAVTSMAGAAGTTVTGSSFMSSPMGEAMVAGAGAGATTGTMLSWSGQTRFERTWTACMESRGYTIVPPEERAPTSPQPTSPQPTSPPSVPP